MAEMNGSSTPDEELEAGIALTFVEMTDNHGQPAAGLLPVRGDAEVERGVAMALNDARFFQYAPGELLAEGRTIDARTRPARSQPTVCSAIWATVKSVG